jgi:hypothetical protein
MAANPVARLYDRMALGLRRDVPDVKIALQQIEAWKNAVRYLIDVASSKADDTDAMRALWMISHSLDDVAETVLYDLRLRDVETKGAVAAAIEVTVRAVAAGNLHFPDAAALLSEFTLGGSMRKRPN